MKHAHHFIADAFKRRKRQQASERIKETISSCTAESERTIDSRPTLSLADLPTRRRAANVTFNTKRFARALIQC